MGKRVDNDATMEVSTSQLVTDNPRNDMSVWKQRVVDSDQFAPAPEQPRDRRVLYVLLALFVFTAAAAVAYFVG